MPQFSQKSDTKLGSCERDIQTVFREAIKIVDFSVIFGHRDVDLQQELFEKGRVLKNNAMDPKEYDSWKIVNKRKVVTYLNGHTKKSNHNYQPSKAIDIIPFPFNGWDKDTEFAYLAGVIMTVADRLWREGKVEKQLQWGGNWKTFKDYPHYEF